MKLSIIAATVLVAGTLGAQQPKPATKAPATATAPMDTTHHKVAKKGAKKTAKHDSTAKHDTTHAGMKKKTP